VNIRGAGGKAQKEAEDSEKKKENKMGSKKNDYNRRREKVEGPPRKNKKWGGEGAMGWKREWGQKKDTGKKRTWEDGTEHGPWRKNTTEGGGTEVHIDKIN